MSELNIHQRMNAILSSLPAIGKDQKNPQQGFMFRGHDDILNALNPLLAEYEVTIVPAVLERVADQRVTSKGSVMYEVNLHVRYRFYGPDGGYVDASTWGEGTDMGDKATNKAMTMAFKNALNQTFAISSEEFKDSDGGAVEDTTGRKKSETEQSGGPRAVQKKQTDELDALLTKLETHVPKAEGQKSYREDVRYFVEHTIGVADPTNLTETQFDLVLEEVKRWVKDEALPMA